MEPVIPPLVATLLLFLGMLMMLETGRRLGIGRRRQETDSDRSNLGTIESALFAVFGLLMALTFTGATSRFNEKRMLIAQEANTVQTALRIGGPEPGKSERHAQPHEYGPSQDVVRREGIEFVISIT